MSYRILPEKIAYPNIFSISGPPMLSKSLGTLISPAMKPNHPTRFTAVGISLVA